MSSKSLAMLVLCCFFLPLWGCVSTGKYELKEREAGDLTKSLGELRQKYVELSRENAGLTEQVKKLGDDAAALAREKEKLIADNRELDGILKARSDSLSRNITELRQRIAELEGDNEKLREEIADLRRAGEEEVENTSKTYEEMLEKMKNEISRGEVTISELKGKLTVNMVDAILFDSGKAEIKPEGREVLKKVTGILGEVKDKAIRIEGHTDNVKISGDLARRFPTNWELSAARALNVTRYLQSQGVDPAILSAVAYGEFNPVAPNDTEEGKAKNRRIEIILIPKD